MVLLYRSIWKLGNGQSGVRQYGNNQITNTGYAYDAAGDVTADGTHTYTYDAEGNLTQIDGGSTAAFTYDAENERVRRDIPGNLSNEYIFNAFGKHASVWDATHGWASRVASVLGIDAGRA